MSLEEALFKRRSVREYSSVPLRLEEVSQLLWAAQGITSEVGGRTAPSAGGLYPLTVYLAAGGVVDLAPGVYRYVPDRQELSTVKGGDVRDEMSEASLDQPWVKSCACSLVLSANYEITSAKYGDRGTRYVQLEAGHVAQNICLQAITLNLGAVTVGAFNDARIKESLGIPDNESPIYIIPIGNVGD
jgi:SagB-type dehydrogenase family enzyme